MPQKRGGKKKFWKQYDNVQDNEDIVLNQKQAEKDEADWIKFMEQKGIFHSRVNGKTVVNNIPKKNLTQFESTTAKLKETVFHSKISNNVFNNTVHVISADGMIIGWGTLVSDTQMLIPGHYMNSKPVIAATKRGNSRVAIAKRQVCDTKTDDCIIICTLEKPLPYCGAKLKIAKGTDFGVFCSANSFQVSSFTLKDHKLVYTGDSIHGDCGQALINENGEVIGIHMGTSQSHKTSRICHGIPITADVLSKLESKDF